MNSTYGIVIILTLSIIIQTSGAKGIQIRKATSDGHLQIQDETTMAWKDLLTAPGENIPVLKVLCRTLGLPSDQVKRLGTQDWVPTSSSSLFMYLNCSGNETTLDNCQRTVIDDNDLFAEATLINLECKGLSFKLYGGSDEDGLVLVSYQTEYVPVCLKKGPGILDKRFAAVICHNLGFNVSHPMVMYPYKYTPGGKEVTRALQLELSCNGDNCEVHTSNTEAFCESSYGITYIQVAAVFCRELKEEYRLNDKTYGGSIGRLELKVNGTWGPVCSTASGSDFAEHVCDIMGEPSTDAQFYKTLYNGGEFDPGSLTLNFCGQDKDHIETCSYNMFGKACDDEKYLGLSCAKATEGKLRILSGSEGMHSGQVEIYHLGSWSGVGVDSSKPSAIQEATVICRTLNLSTNGVEWEYTMYNRSLWLDSIDCSGNETELSQCQGASLSMTVNKTLGIALSVSCGTNENGVRLGNNGLLEIKRMGQWGTVCANRFRNLEAAVMCKALNKPYTMASRTTGSNDPKRTGTVWEFGIRCNTIYDDWKNCTNHRYAYFSNGCTHYNDVFVKCGELDKSAVNYRLTNGPVPRSGYVEVYINNTWGYVCNDGLSQREAKTLCRSMNYSTAFANIIRPNNLLKPLNNSKVWLTGLKCTGSEASILDCEHRYLGDGSCSSWGENKVAVYCGMKDTSDDLSLRIAGGSKSGLLEIKLFGEWGTVCNRGFDKDDAQVACRQMNLTWYQAEVAHKNSYSSGSGRIWMSNLNCKGYESNLKTCKYPPVGSTDCKHSEDVGVTCKGFTPIDYYHFESRVGIIVGASVGATAFVFILGTIIAVVLIARQRRGAISSTQPVNYSVPVNGNLAAYPTTHAQPPYPGYHQQFTAPVPGKKQ